MNLTYLRIYHKFFLGRQTFNSMYLYQQLFALTKSPFKDMSVNHGVYVCYYACLHNIQMPNLRSVCVNILLHFFYQNDSRTSA